MNDSPHSFFLLAKTVTTIWTAIVNDSGAFLVTQDHLIDDLRPVFTSQSSFPSQFTRTHKVLVK